MADIKLFYFDARGVAEVSRLVLAFAKQPYEDIRWSMDEWPEYKKQSPFGQAPWIEYKGEKRSQSVGIATFLAQKYGLYGKTNLEALRIDEVIYLVVDVRQGWSQVHYEEDATKKAELEKKFDEQDLPKFLGHFVTLLEKNATGVFVGNELTLADIYVYDLVYQLNKVRNYDALSKFPALTSLKSKVEGNPDIARYLAARKDTPR